MKRSELLPHELEAAAKVLGCDVPAIQAFASVEAGPYGAWMPDGDHPVVLFERHVFRRLTHGVYDDVESGLSHPKPGGYGRHVEQPARLARARELDDEAAVKATSWGLFQVMGFNHRLAGHKTLASFEAAMRREVFDHLTAFVLFVNAQPKLAAAVRRHDWWTAARLYNGKDHAKHDYAGRLTRAFQRFTEAA